MTNHLLFLGNLGGGEIIIIALIVLLLFGGKKIPELMRGIGKGRFNSGAAGSTKPTTIIREPVKWIRKTVSMRRHSTDRKSVV